MRHLRAPFALLLIGVAIGVGAWWTSGVVLYVFAAACAAVAMAWATVLSLTSRPHRLLAGILAGALVAALALATPWWLAARAESNDVGWSSDLTQSQRATLVEVVGERVYVVSLDQDDPAEVIALDRRTGRTLWTRSLPGISDADADDVTLMATAAGEVAIGSGRTVVRLSRTGTVRWTRALDGSIQTFTARTVVVLACGPADDLPTSSCRYEGVDETGKTTWSLRTDETTDRTWQISRDGLPRDPEPSVVAVVTGSDTKRVARVVDPDTGETLNSTPLAADDRRPDIWRVGDRAWMVTRKGFERDCRWRVLDAKGSREITPGGRCDEISTTHLVDDQTLFAHGTGHGWRVDLAGGRVTPATSSEVTEHLDDYDATERRLEVAPLERGNPFHHRHGGGDDLSPHRVTLLDTSGRTQAETTCARGATAEVVGDGWALVRCGAQLQMLRGDA